MRKLFTGALAALFMALATFMTPTTSQAATITSYDTPYGTHEINISDDFFVGFNYTIAATAPTDVSFMVADFRIGELGSDSSFDSAVLLAGEVLSTVYAAAADVVFNAYLAFDGAEWAALGVDRQDAIVAGISAGSIFTIDSSDTGTGGTGTGGIGGGDPSVVPLPAGLPLLLAALGGLGLLGRRKRLATT